MRRGWEIVAGLAAVALAGCHGPPLVEFTPDGGGAGRGGTGGGGNAGSSGTSGTAGRGGTTGTAGTGGAGRGGTTGAGGVAGTAGRGGGGGTAGAGCAAQMTPQMFYRGNSPPFATSGTAARLYWGEFGSPYITFHYSPASPPGENKHPVQFGSAGVGSYEIIASDARVAATWGLNGEIAAWGPDSDSTQIGRMTLTYPSAIAIDGPLIFYSYQPSSGSATWGIYTWDPPSSPTLFVSYAELGGDRTLGLLLRVTPTKLLFSDKTDAWFVDRTTKGAKQLLFNNPGTRLIIDVRPAHPFTIEGPIIVDVDDPIIVDGRDYFVNLSQPTAAPKDLATATTTLADASACGTAARFNGTGLIYQQHYIYEGNGGLFMVDISANGTVSNLVRLTDAAFGYPDVTESGDLFAGQVYNVSRWDYYRIGKL